MVLLILLPKLNQVFSLILPEYLEPKYQDEALNQSLEMAKTFSGNLLDNELLNLSLNDLVNKDNVENQIQEFKKILFEVGNTYIDSESAYDLVSDIINRIIKIMGDVRPSIDGLEDFVIENRRIWREKKEWMGHPGGSKEQYYSNSWRSKSEQFLLEVESIEKIESAATILEHFKGIFSRVDIEIETLRKRRAINLVFRDGNFHESRGTIKVGDYSSFLSIDESEGKAMLVHSRDATLVDKRTALRQANSICKTGFLLGNGRRIGVGCQLAESEGSQEE